MKIEFTPNNLTINDQSYPYELVFVEVNLPNKQIGWRRIIFSIFIYSLIFALVLAIPLSGLSLQFAEAIMIVFSIITILYIIGIINKQYMLDFALLGIKGEVKKYFLYHGAKNSGLISLIAQKGGTVTYNEFQNFKRGKAL